MSLGSVSVFSAPSFTLLVFLFDSLYLSDVLFLGLQHFIFVCTSRDFTATMRGVLPRYAILLFALRGAPHGSMIRCTGKLIGSLSESFLGKPYFNGRKVVSNWALHGFFMGKNSLPNSSLWRCSLCELKPSSPKRTLVFFRNTWFKILKIYDMSKGAL